MEHLYFVLIGLGSLVGVSELVAFANTSPSLYGRLPFKHDQAVPLPDTDEAVLKQDATGDTATGTWRYFASLRLLMFRRRFEMGADGRRSGESCEAACGGRSRRTSFRGRRRAHLPRRKATLEDD